MGTLLTVGWTTVDLNAAIQTAYFTIFDWANSTQINFSDVLTLVGADGLTFTVPFNDAIQIWLPVPRQHMQVLTWDDINHVAYWENNQCCAQTLSFDTVTNLLSISWTNSVDLTSINTDNQELILAGNILSITQLNWAPQAVDLTNVNEHTLWLLGNTLSIYGCDWILNNDVDLTNVNEHTLTLAANLLSILGSDWVANATVDLTNVNEHTLWLVWNLLDIYGSDGISNDQVNLTNVNEHTLWLVGNLLSILGSDGVVNFTVDLSNVNEHTLGIAGTRWCPAQTGDVVITIYGSDGVANNSVSIPAPAVSCCDDVMACAWIQSILADIVILTNRIIAAENAIQLLQWQLP